MIKSSIRSLEILLTLAFVMVLAKISNGVSSHTSHLIRVQVERIDSLEQFYELETGSMIWRGYRGAVVLAERRVDDEISKVWLQTFQSVFGVSVADAARKMLSKEVRIPIRNHRDMTPAKACCYRNAQRVIIESRIPVVGGSKLIFPGYSV